MTAKFLSLAAALIGAAALACAQNAAPEFEAASVKPATEFRGQGMFLNSCTGGPGSGDPSRLTCTGLTLQRLLTIAYEVQPSQITGPSWMDSERYNIAAKVPAGTTPEQIGPMLQQLLADRFHMTVRKEARTQPYYALLVAKGGPKLTPGLKPGEEEDPEAAKARGRAAGQKAREDGPGWSHMFIGDQRMTMKALASAISHRLDHPMLDFTGLTGTYAVNLAYVVDGPRPADSDAHPTTLTQALEEVGLRMEARKGPVDVVVVDNASKTPRDAQ